MTAKQQIDLAKALLTAVEAHNIDSTGALTFKSIKDDISLAYDVEAAFKAAGIAVPVQVDAVLAGLVAVASMLGVK